MFRAVNKLERLFLEDQSERNAIDHSDESARQQLALRDEQRRESVLKLLRKNKIVTSVDYYYAAFIFHHGITVQHIVQANRFAEQSISAADYNPNDDNKFNEGSKWLLASTTDRILMYEEKPQKYGTQFYDEGGKLKIWPIDPHTSDEDRRNMNVTPPEETLSSLLQRLPQFAR